MIDRPTPPSAADELNSGPDVAPGEVLMPMSPGMRWAQVAQLASELQPEGE